MSSLFSIGSKFGYTFVIRVGVPGLFAASVLFSLFNPLLPEMLRIAELDDIATIGVPAAIVLGLFLSLFRSPIYQFYEGRSPWPAWLSNLCISRLEKKVEKRLALTKELLETSVRYKELWYWLRMFPLDGKGDPQVTHPTLLGNVMQGYEEYPDTRYGMDSVFYWYRLWFKLPKEVASHLDLVWAEADCLTYTSFVFLLSALLYLVASLARWAASYFASPIAFEQMISALPPPAFSVARALLSLAAFYLIYKFSIPIIRRNGEYFKAIFDLYRGEIKTMTEIPTDELAKWKNSGGYLQYLYVQCPNCGEYHYAHAKHECLKSS